MQPAESGELLQPSPVAASPPRSLAAATPATPQQGVDAPSQEVAIIKTGGRRGLCCCGGKAEAAPPADVDAKGAASPRQRQRDEAREANRPLWEPVCGLMWTPDGARWSTFTTVVVVLHVSSQAISRCL